ncbi:hypothetical protein IV45_GL001106 [Limosilactobacillus secaliphilus]|uniref:Protein PsiE n=1 Tax=Limosilactobacillus secaliphilus TaxID=396268 RepID=A0A0R2I1M6_9LACO|nr:hypothetical protein IV45_GL001106 [Limosilactobacillus secaliphilus]
MGKEEKKVKQFEHWSQTISKILQVVSIIALAVLGFAIIAFLAEELIAIVELAARTYIADVYKTALQEIITFFLFFEFLAMAASALSHHGHLTVDFLISLGITALLRGLIAFHGEPMENLLTALAILVLIIGDIILHRFLDDSQS